MAKEAEAAAAPKKSKKLLIIIGLVVVLLLGGGGAAFFLMKGDHEEGDEDEVVVEKAKPSKKKAAKEVMPTYIALDAFTVNLIPENGEQFMQLMLSIEVEDAHVGDKVRPIPRRFAMTSCCSCPERRPPIWPPRRARRNWQARFVS